MSSTVPIEIPREILNITHMTPAELKQELAVYLFQQGKLSFGKAREMADMSAWDFQFVLGSRKIPVHYDLEDYEEDRETLKELGRLLCALMQRFVNAPEEQVCKTNGNRPRPRMYLMAPHWLSS